MNKTTEQIIVDIMLHEMGFPESSVWLRDENKVIPKDDALYMMVGMIGAPQVIGAIGRTEPYTPPAPAPQIEVLKEIQEMTTQENIQIDLFSRSDEARMRRAEPILALRSIYSQQMQELYRFKIFALPSSFVNTSSAEGGSQIKRFSITMACHVWYRKEKIPTGYDYYDDFDTRVDDEKTIGTENGIIEFNAPADYED